MSELFQNSRAYCLQGHAKDSGPSLSSKETSASEHAKPAQGLSAKASYPSSSGEAAQELISRAHAGSAAVAAVARAAGMTENTGRARVSFCSGRAA